MPQSLLKLNVHLIFSTKNRQPLIHEQMRPELHNYLGGVLNNQSCPIIRAGGTADHVHLFFGFARTISFADLVEEIKKSSSKWMKAKGCADFYWQSGYGAFGIGETGEKALIRYIGQQEEHHRLRSFQEELRAFLKKHEVPYDERYVWD